MLTQYKVAIGEDITFEVEIDTDTLTEDKALEINQFFGDADYRLANHEGDVYAAVCQLIAPIVIRDITIGWGDSTLNKSLRNAEGFYEVEGIKITNSHHECSVFVKKVS